MLQRPSVSRTTNTTRFGWRVHSTRAFTPLEGRLFESEGASCSTAFPSLQPFWRKGFCGSTDSAFESDSLGRRDAHGFKHPLDAKFRVAIGLSRRGGIRFRTRLFALDGLLTHAPARPSASLPGRMARIRAVFCAHTENA